ncbi:hypothetical protein B0H10DRAFT_1955500 [Mycena sp. CBHHK59/15]|nr:hypothetical protein B0H10DRAFT_1955500 [Mycena sp. CBHHK59/15]
MYISGTIHTPSSKKTTAAAGIVTESEDNRGTRKCIPSGDEQSQYVAEFFAALEAIRSVGKETTLTIVSAQPYVHDVMSKKLWHWEHEGWTGVPHRGILRCVAAELKARIAPTFLKVALPGAPERTMCRKVAGIAKRVARAPVPTTWDLTLPLHTALPGMSLVGNCQKIFHRSIREEKTKKLTLRASTVKKLEVVRTAAYEIFDRCVSDTDIWRSVHAKDLLPHTVQFLWKSLHNAHKIGMYWTHIPECKDCAICQGCGDLENLEHILLECECPGQELIWKAAETLWLEKESHWPEPASDDEIMNKWRFAVNQRLQMDKLLANRPRKGKHPTLAPQMVLETWSGTLDNESSLPTNWLQEPRVLVGSRAFPQTLARRQNSHGIG